MACFSSTAQSQGCVQNLPRFVNQGSFREEPLVNGTQAIIPEYSFDCYGNVTQWGAVVRNRNGVYTLVFQVLRRSGGGQGTTGCYTLVGNNYFASIRPAWRGRGRILADVPVEQQIKVHPGDVIGFYVQNTTRANSGVQVQQTGDDDEDNEEEDSSSFGRHAVVTAWYGPVSTSVAAAAGSCMLRVGSNSDYDLRSSTTAVPIITASVAVFTPSPSQTPSPSRTPSPSPTPSLLPSTFPSSLPESALPITSTVQLVDMVILITQTGTPQTTEIQTLAQFSTLPQPSSFLSPSLLPEDLGLELGVTVAIVIVVVIVIVVGVLLLVFILALALRRSKKRVQMMKSLDNPEYSGKNIIIFR